MGQFLSFSEMGPLLVLWGSTCNLWDPGYMWVMWVRVSLNIMGVGEAGHCLTKRLSEFGRYLGGKQ